MNDTFWTLVGVGIALLGAGGFVALIGLGLRLRGSDEPEPSIQEPVFTFNYMISEEFPTGTIVDDDASASKEPTDG